MRRFLPLLLLLTACAPGPAPQPDAELRWTSGARVAGDTSDLEVHVVARGTGLPAGATLHLGFAHWYYSLRHSVDQDPYPPRPPAEGSYRAWTADGPVPTRVEQADQGHWYVEATLPAVLAPEQALTFRLDRWLSPNGAGPVSPLVLLREADERPWRRLDPAPGQEPLDLVAGDARALFAAPASLSRVDAPVPLRWNARDRYGNLAARPARLTARWLLADSERGLDAALHDDGTVAPPPDPGPWILELSSPGLTPARAAVLVTAEEPPRLAWADLHGHCALSDGRGTPEAYFRYASDVALLDAAALSDHDWQLTHDEVRHLVQAADDANSPGRFTALPAFEINLAGHEVVWFFDSPALLALAPGGGPGITTIWQEHHTDELNARLQPPPRALLGALPEGSFLMATHTSMSRPMGSDLELARRLPNVPMIEVYSAHGSSECRACARSLNPPGPGDDEALHSVREALVAQPHLALYAAGDSHDGRPGDSRWGAFPGGLAGIWTDELSREGLHEALAAGRVFATGGRRSLVEMRPDALRLHDVEPVERVVVVRGEQVVQTIQAPARGAWIPLPAGGEGPLYVSVHFADGGLAWATSPKK